MQMGKKSSFTSTRFLRSTHMYTHHIRSTFYKADTIAVDSFTIDKLKLHSKLKNVNK